MLDTTTPFGSPITVPENLGEDRPYFEPRHLSQAAAYYETEGYVVLRGLIPPELCDAVRAAFDAEVRSTRTPILRQKNMAYERNKLDTDGFLANPIFNVQDLQTRRFGGFKGAALDILTDAGVAGATATFLGCPSKVIQSMFFEAPAGTWAHQDSYYQDSASRLGGCVAGWFALEDIDAGAGRFYVCPRTHTDMELIRNSGATDFASGHERYQRAIVGAIEAGAFELRAPYLAKGDVLFWSSLTVHGSLGAARPHLSRASLTAHYIPAADEMLQFHSRIRAQTSIRHNATTVCLLHDQNELRHRLLRDIAFLAPGPWAYARRIAIKTLLLTRRPRASDVTAQPEPANIQ